MARLKVREAPRAWAEEAAKLRGLLRALIVRQSLASMVPRMASRSNSAGLL